MGKVTKVLVCGPTNAGKTSLIEQCLFGNYDGKKPEDNLHTYQDTYNAIIETDRGVREKTRFYEVGGGVEVDRYLCQTADVFFIVYDLTDPKSLTVAQDIKRKLEEARGDREAVFVLCGNKSDQPRMVDTSKVEQWGFSEKVQVCECMASNREMVCAMFSRIVSFVNQPQSSFAVEVRQILPLQEPAYLLLPPNRCGQGASPLTSTIGPCTSLVELTFGDSTCELGGAGGALVASGHLNGWIVLWCVAAKGGSSRQHWLGHPVAQVTGLQAHRDSGLLVSHGRDGWIRFWRVDEAVVSARQPGVPSQALSEVRTCSFTFCAISLWPADSRAPGRYYLAHVCQLDGESDGDGCIEAIQLPDNTISVSYSYRRPAQATPTSGDQSELGMCMVIQGIPNFASTYLELRHKCVFLAGFEAGHILQIADGKVLTRLHHCLGGPLPVMSIAAHHSFRDNTLLLAVGGPQQLDEGSEGRAADLVFLRLSLDPDTKSFQLEPTSRQVAKAAETGVSSLAWRTDDRLLAIGQWDGCVRLVEVSDPIACRLRCLGWLTGLGCGGGGHLLGDWSATTVSKARGPIIDQQSMSVRACLFTRTSNWLVTSAPANSGATGSLLVWDVYRSQ